MNQTMVVTERNGVIAVFTRNHDGTVRQRLIMDAEDADLHHAELATFATTLGHQFGWLVAPEPRASKRVAAAKAKAVTPAKRTIARPTRRSLPRGTGANALRPAWTAEVMERVNKAPGSTKDQIADAINMHNTTVHNLLTDLVAAGHVRYEQAGQTKPRHYWAVDTSAYHAAAGC